VAALLGELELGELTIIVPISVLTGGKALPYESVRLPATMNRLTSPVGKPGRVLLMPYE
jgi:hypothetical protein